MHQRRDIQRFKNPAQIWRKAGRTALLFLWVTCGGGCGPEKPPGFDEISVHRDLVAAVNDANKLVIDYRGQQPVTAACEPFGAGVYCSSADPGFASLTESRGDLYPLDPRTTIFVELLAATPGARLRLETAVAEQPGQRLRLGTGEDVHAHASWEFFGNEAPPEIEFVFRIVTDPPLYEPSAPFALRFVLESSGN
jgi:hypothetical protein